ncbi:hypothetical protein G9A89_000521 [Geosiphon pyriformis]|nr:hypothetical protein G9A89_000521 [Geosiphon pyriformis]
MSVSSKVKNKIPKAALGDLATQLSDHPLTVTTGKVDEGWVGKARECFKYCGNKGGWMRPDGRTTDLYTDFVLF